MTGSCCVRSSKHPSCGAEALSLLSPTNDDNNFFNMPPASPRPDNPVEVQNSYIFIPFAYSVIVPALGANASTIFPFTLDQDADFELHYIMGSSSIDDPTKFFQNNFSVQITDKSNSRIWSSDRVPQIQQCGPMNMSIAQRRPVLLARKTNMSFDVLNLTATGGMVVTMGLHGYKVIPQ